MPSDWLNNWENKVESAQIDLFAKKEEATASSRPVEDRPLWKHQVGAINAAVPALRNAGRALVVLPTGGGKSRTANEIISAINEPTLFIAHRDTLIEQAIKNATKDTSLSIGVEKAWRYGHNEDIVVACLQTISKDDRLARFPKDRFGLIVYDECHHGASLTGRRVLEHFNAKRLGITATPDRSDEKKIAKLFGPPIFLYEMVDAIKDGVLCDIVCSRFTIAGLDMSSVRTSGGDYSEEDLDRAFKVEGVLQGVADTVFREAGDRSTIIFSTSIPNSRRLCEILNRHSSMAGRPDCATFVDSKLDSFEVQCRLKQHSNGEFQFLVNVGICTEGYDDTKVSCIAIARPTKSRSLCAQMVGRGARSHPGKKDCKVIDFTGNLGIKHGLCTPLDVVGANYEDDVIEIAEKLIKEDKEKKVTDALSEAALIAERQKQEELARASRLGAVAKAIYTKSKVDPFSVIHVGQDADRQRAIDRRFGGTIPSDGQIKALERFGVPLTKFITKSVAGQLIDKLKERAEKGLARYKQVALLRKYGIDAEDFSFESASRSIDIIAKCGWSLPPWEKARIIREARK